MVIEGVTECSYGLFSLNIRNGNLLTGCILATCIQYLVDHRRQDGSTVGNKDLGACKRLAFSPVLIKLVGLQRLAFNKIRRVYGVVN